MFKMTFKIAIACLVLQIIQSFRPGILPLQVFYLSYLSHKATLVLGLLTLFSHMFSHANWGHILGNLEAGIPAMCYVEYKLGGRNMLKLYLISGVVAALTQGLLVQGSLIGASGAIFGCRTASCLLLCKGRVSTAVGMALLMIVLLPQLAMMGGFDGIAHAAHVGGGIAGLLVVAMDYKR